MNVSFDSSSAFAGRHIGKDRPFDSQSHACSCTLTSSLHASILPPYLQLHMIETVTFSVCRRCVTLRTIDWCCGGHCQTHMGCRAFVNFNWFAP
ncbi:hypothetical protein ABKN59_009556 [Abortiporus biennis]